MKTLFSIVALSACIFHAALAATPILTCPVTACAAIYRPVCAVLSDGSTRTYGTSCAAAADANCYGLRYLSVTEGECPKECPAKCPLFYDPVCVTDSAGNRRTYYSACAASNARCALGLEIADITKGKCIDSCVTFCRLDYRPICVVDAYGVYHNYSNNCAFNYDVCKKRIDLTNAVVTQDTLCPSTCSKICNFNYDPICTIDSNGIATTYASSCVLNNAVCEGYSYVTSYKGPCVTECPGGCGSELEPICVTDKDGNSITFPNECVLKNSQCVNKVEYVTRVPGQCTSECPTMCPRILQPVCLLDSNGQYTNYNSPCEARADACRRRVKVIKISDGTCCKDNGANCTKEYNPICVTKPDGTTAEYANKCYYDTAVKNRQIQPTFSTSSGECKCDCRYVMEPIPVCGRSSCGQVQLFYGPCELQNQNTCKGSDFVEVNIAECLVKCACKDTDLTSRKPLCAKYKDWYQVFPGSCQLDLINLCLNKKFEAVPCV